jgi:flagellar hook-basal body complex protein FliE
MINSVGKLMPTNGLSQINEIQSFDKKNVDGASFSDALTAAIEKVNSQQIQSEKATEALASGKAPDLHTVMITAEKATLSFQLAVQVRNKVMEAYQEIMRMQV